MTPTQRYQRKPSDWVTCPTCRHYWQRTNRQRQDGTLCCSVPCANSQAAQTAHHRERIRHYRATLRGDQRLMLREEEVAILVRHLILAYRDGRSAERQKLAKQAEGRAA